jgi:hypothetical protein
MFAPVFHGEKPSTLLMQGLTTTQRLKTTKDQVFCRNEHNVSGYCSRQSCPLANSRYATIRSDPATGGLYLYIKEIERNHLPSKWWEKIKLPSNYAKALELVDQHCTLHCHNPAYIRANFYTSTIFPQVPRPQEQAALDPFDSGEHPH